MKRNFLVGLLTALLLLSTTLPASAGLYWPQDYQEISGQKASPSGLEHYVFWEQYLNAFFGTDDGIRYWNTNSPSTSDITYWVDQAMSRWNGNTQYGNFDDSVRVSSQSDADLLILYQACPAGGPACVVITQYQFISGFNVNTWKKATIYITPNPAGGPSWSTPGMIMAIMHEYGHIVGLGEQYDDLDPPAVCNYDNAPSVMDTLKISQSNQWVPCDADYVTSADNTRLNTFYETGTYTLNSYEFPCGNTCAEAWLVDRSWNDWYYDVWWYWGNSPGGNFYSFANTTDTTNNGSHETVPKTPAINLKSRVYPNNYGLHGKYLKVCWAPALYEKPDGTIKYGTNTCASSATYWP